METKIYQIRDPAADREAVEAAARVLRAGGIAAIPTETVYGLAANAFDADAVKKIFEAKGRPQDNPLIVHIADAAQLKDVAAETPPAALALAEACWPGPLTIILPKKDCIPDAVSAGLPTVAVRCPAHPAARAVIRAAGVPLAAPSANLSGFPSPTSAQHVIDDMTGRIPLILDGGDCDYGIESTVVTLATDPPRLLRPGAVTPERLREILGTEVEIDDAVLHPLREGEKAASPGMKYRHYAPKAELTVVRGDLLTFLRYARENACRADHVLCFEEEARYMPLPAVTFGRRDDPLTQTHRLFDALRELDAENAKTVFVREPDAHGVGLGVCNRLFRAAGFRFLEPRGCVIGICGLSGAGKSTVCALLAQTGAAVTDTDRIAREITLPGSPVLPALAAVFGEEILLPDGSLDRKKLARRAFADKAATEKLNAVTHPEILRRTRAAAQAATAAGKTAVLDVPLLFTSGLDALCDLTAAVTAPEAVRRARLKEREGLTDEEADRRFAAQREEEALLARADLTLLNDGAQDPAEETEKIFTCQIKIKD